MTENEKGAAARVGIPFCISTPQSAALGAILEALSARYLGERALRAGDEVLLLGNISASVRELLCKKGIQAVSAEEGLVSALSPAARALIVATDGTKTSALVSARHFCNDYDLWLIVITDRRSDCFCEFDGVPYHATAVGDFGIEAAGESEYIFTKDVQLYHLLVP